MPRTSLLTIAFCFASPQGNGLWHPQWALQVWCHPGELNLCLLRRDNQSGSHPSGFLCSGWRWPARFAPARDSRTGPDVSNWGQGGRGQAGVEEEKKRAMFGKIEISISILFCRYLKERGQRERRAQRDKNKTPSFCPFYSHNWCMQLPHTPCRAWV